MSTDAASPPPLDPRHACSLRVGTRERVQLAGNGDSRHPGASAHDAREQAIAALAARQHGVAGSRQLVALGLSKGSIAHRVRQGRLHGKHRGVYAVGHERLTAAGRQMAAVLVCGAGAALSHVSSAATLDMRGTEGRVIHVTVPPGNGSTSRPGIRVHRGRELDAEDVVYVDSRPVTSVARTLVDLGDVVPPEQVRRAFIRAEQARAIDMAEIDRALGRSGRRSGPAILRQLLGVYDPRWSQTRSVLEIAMLDLTQRFELPAPEVNEWLLGRYLVDFLWREQRLVVETDGNEIHGAATARRDDARRDHALRRAGFRVLRVRYRSVTGDPGAVAARIAAALHKRQGPSVVRAVSAGSDQ